MRHFKNGSLKNKMKYNHSTDDEDESANLVHFRQIIIITDISIAGHGKKTVIQILEGLPPRFPEISFLSPSRSARDRNATSDTD